MSSLKMKKDLHLANSVEALDSLAHKTLKNINPDKLYNSAEKIFQAGLQTYGNGDEETAYIMFVRFILVYKHLDEKTDDKRYTKQRLGREYTTASDLLHKLKISLSNRYEEQKKEIITPPIIEAPKPDIKKSDPVLSFPNEYITCNELYILLNKKVDIVILDARPQEYYLQSSMKNPCCVNIPEEVIRSGSSANTLGKQVPNESQTQWDRRWKASVTILLDWSSTKETLTGSKLSVLKDILIHWDPSMIDNKPPIILNGGYLEWLNLYPMLCTNPDIIYEVQNSVLNDLLDLDSIEYPSTEETTPAKYLKPVINRATKPPIFNKGLKVNVGAKRSATATENVINLDELRNKRSLEAEEGMRIELQQREEKLLEDKAALEKSKQELNEENEQLRKKLHIIETPEEESETDEDVREDIREKLLQEAREQKKTILLQNLLSEQMRIKVQEFDKQMKTTGKSVVLPGLTGLTNLGSTCYMNSVIQCYSNTRIIHNFFVFNCNLDGEDFTGKFGDISREFRNINLRIWSGHFKNISPAKFKYTVDRYGPRFKGNDQQDAHEFMVSLNTWLHDELKRDVKRALQVVWTPRQKSWINSTEGKTSIILEAFCGQQLNTISCDECKRSKEKLELFENLTLALPTQGFCTLEDCLNQYYSKQQIQDYSCQKCKSNKLVSMEMRLVGHPPVLALCLKRFSEALVDGRYNYVKNIVSVKYPLLNLNLFGSPYNLYAVIVHRTSGVTLDSGHYFAIVKNLWNGKWYKYDDTYVTEVSRTEALQPTDAYMLFYQSRYEEKLCNSDYIL